MGQRYPHHKRDKKNNWILQVLNNKKILVAITAIVAILLFFNFKSFILFIVIAAIATVINYFIHVTNLHIHLGHVSFLAVIFSYTLGFKYGLFMILIAHVLAESIAGHADVEMIITGSVYTVNCFIASLLGGVNIFILGIGLTIFQAVATIALGMGAGTPIAELITEDAVEFVMLIIYYLVLSRPLVGLILL